MIDVLGFPKQTTILALEFLGFKCGFSVESLWGGHLVSIMNRLNPTWKCNIRVNDQFTFHKAVA